MNLSHTRRHISSRCTTGPADERGQTLTEYSVLVGLIAVVVAVALPLLGTSIVGLFSAVVSALGG